MRMIPDNAAGAGFFGKYLGYMGTGLSPALLGVGYIVGLNIGIVVLSGSVLAWHIAIPLYHAFLLNGDPDPVAGARWSASRGRSGRDHLVGEASATSASAPCWSAASGRCSRCAIRCCRASRAASRPRARVPMRTCRETERDLPMKWMLVALVAVRAAAAGPVPGHRRQLGCQHPDDDHHDRGRLPVRVRLGVPRRLGRFVEQSGVGHHHRHHPVRLGGADAAAGQRLQDRCGRRWAPWPRS
jgi:hypothetical protein